MIGTAIAMERGYEVDAASLNGRKEQLLRNKEYRECIASSTMQTVNINRRISLVLSEIYGMEL